MGSPAPEYPQYKGQPWILYDTIASSDFRLGSAVPAIGGNSPAFNANGECTFFNGVGRTTSNMPWFTNLDLPGQLSFGMEVYAMYFAFQFPALFNFQSISGVPDGDAEAGVPPTVKLAECILNFGSLELNLGQEQQSQWPLTRFGAGGGLTAIGASFAIPQNSIPQNANVMVMPEPIMMPRTQNLFAKIRLAPEVQAMIGRGAANGVGMPLGDYNLLITPGEAPVLADLDQPPYAIQFGLIGKRIKDVQYGALAPGQRA